MSKYNDLCEALEKKGLRHELVRQGSRFELKVIGPKNKELASAEFFPGKPDAAAQEIARQLLYDLP